MKWNAESLSAALGVNVPFEFAADTVAIDSGKINAREIFVALAGKKNDGHAYVADAFKNNAACAIVEYKPDNLADAAKLAVVPDTLKALSALGRYRRSQSEKLKAVAVTGSVGKTTVKEMLAGIARNFGETVYSPASYNNHVGVPLALEKLTATTEFGVFEIGMNNFGEIAPLSDLVKPDIAIITGIAPSHIGHLGSMEGIVDEKSTVFFGLKPGGVALIQGDHPLTDRIIANARKYDLGEIFTVGASLNSAAEIVAYESRDNGRGCLVTARILGEKITYPMGFAGQHSAFNGLYALLCAKILGIDLNDAARCLSLLSPAPGRGQILRFKLPNGSPILVFDDAYNANPASMRKGLEAFVALKAFGERVAIIGHMGELGEFSDGYHEEIGRYLNTLPIDRVHAIGHLAAPLYEALSPAKKGTRFAAVDDLLPDFIGLLKGNENIFLKGSFSSRLREITSLLKNSLEAIPDA